MTTPKANKSKANAPEKPATTPKAKDLPAKKNAKGGLRGDGWFSNNHNETWVRA
jgi:hypothetical protein